MNEDFKNAIDLAAVFGGFGSWLALLPDVAALLSCIWLVLRIAESIKRWIKK